MPVKVKEILVENARLRAEAQALQSQYPQTREKIDRLLAMNEGLLAQLQQTLLEVAELKRQLFGSKANKLDAQEEALLAQVQGEREEQAQRGPPLSQDVPKEGEKPNPQPKRRRRNPMPEHLERQTVVLEPEPLAPCVGCGQMPKPIGKEVTEELEFVPAKLVVRQMVRPK